jgi:quinol monooxygenase YgiN
MRIEVWRDSEALELHKATPHLKASFEHRKDAGWMTEITRWERVPEERGEQRAALAR